MIRKLTPLEVRLLQMRLKKDVQEILSGTTLYDTEGYLMQIDFNEHYADDAIDEICVEDNSNVIKFLKIEINLQIQRTIEAYKEIFGSKEKVFCTFTSIKGAIFSDQSGVGTVTEDSALFHELPMVILNADDDLNTCYLGVKIPGRRIMTTYAPRVLLKDYVV